MGFCFLPKKAFSCPETIECRRREEEAVSTYDCDIPWDIPMPDCSRKFVKLHIDGFQEEGGRGL